MAFRNSILLCFILVHGNCLFIFGADPGFSLERGMPTLQRERQNTIFANSSENHMISRKFCSMGEGANYHFSAGFPLGLENLENLEKLEGIFQSGKSQGILMRLEKSGKSQGKSHKILEN